MLRSFAVPPEAIRTDADLFADLSHDRIPRRLSVFDATAGQVPGVDVASMAEEDPVVVIEDDRERARFH